MCGIFGLIQEGKGDSSAIVNDLFKLSESRGKESAGLASCVEGKIKVYKRPIPASSLIKDGKLKNLLKESFNQEKVLLIGHARLMTNGALEINQNNQPVIKDGLVGVHNGIITNTEQLCSQFDLNKSNEVDTETVLSLIRKFLREGKSLPLAVKETFSLIEGSASLAILFNDAGYLLLATNTGSLFVLKTQNRIIFASERYILEKLMVRYRLNGEIKQIKAQNGCFINGPVLYDFNFNQIIDLPKKEIHQDIVDVSPAENIPAQPIDKFEPLPYTDTIFDSLKRCTRCILPETMPFVDFDEQGVCSYCRNYEKVKVEGEPNLKEIIEKYRRNDGKPDCLVLFSGGRDSSYGLHYIKEVLGMNPIAYSYDWGMITDLGRRNQARMCGKLGIEHILVSADIKKKREYIRNNVLAWLRKPDLGLVPLFMAGDKQMFYYADQLRKQTKTKLIIFCNSPLERTHFKSGFCGIKPVCKKGNIPALSLLGELKLASYYAKGYLTNRGYINNSLWDTFHAYICYYLMSHDFLFLFKYINWSEDKMMSVLLNEYNWEMAPDTKTSWRIGDATTPFYNYIYYTMAGFTENDTLRSNQIREGLISREEALRLVREENQPRWEAIKWYCDAIHIDFKKAIQTIDSAPKIY